MPALWREVKFMNDELQNLKKSVDNIADNAKSETVSLFNGIELSYFTLERAPSSFPHRHSAIEHIMQINYCKSGQMEWKMGDGNYIYLNPGDFSLHSMSSCANSLISFPAGGYSGLTICLNLHEIALPCELIKDSHMFLKALQEKFCQNGRISFLAGNEQTKSIFSAFYGNPKDLQLPYQKIKTIELLLYLAKAEITPQKQLSAYRTEQIDIIREIHNRLTGQMNERITIEELSKQYLVNPTTLKKAFKAIYGTSIAAHVKEHRMEQASKMLRETDMSIAEIAASVGYDSQSKFSRAFRATFGVLPREYRKSRK